MSLFVPHPSLPPVFVSSIDSGLFAGVPAAPAHAFHGEHLPPAAELLRGAIRGEGS